MNVVDTERNNSNQATAPCEKPYNIGLIMGVFDIFNIGHLNLIRRAKAQCCFLRVGVLSDKLVYEFKHVYTTVPQEERMEILRALRDVDEVELLETKEEVSRLHEWKKRPFDCFFSGDNYADNSYWAWEKAKLKKLGADMVFFPYTKESDSGMMRKDSPQAYEFMKRSYRSVGEELQKIKEMIYFFDVLNNLPSKSKKTKTGFSIIPVKIPVILSADNNYSCFVATTGASILYNTEAFIEFYILSEGITETNKALIKKAFSEITSDFSVKFIDCNCREHFSHIELFRGYHVSLNTCNRLMFPVLAPKVDRAIYLDVDLIVLDDIKKLWDEDLEGNIIGAVPLFVDRLRTVNGFLNEINVSIDEKYCYFNSGVMLIDYSKWREKEGNNESILYSLLRLSNEIKPKSVPDELILNKYAYLNNCYKQLSHKYNVNPYYSYKWLKNNISKLTGKEKTTLREYEEYINNKDYSQRIDFEGSPVIRHFFGPEKPWNTVTQSWFTIPYTPHFKDFWFYAKITPYFEEIKQRFINEKLRTPKD